MPWEPYRANKTELQIFLTGMVGIRGKVTKRAGDFIVLQLTDPIQKLVPTQEDPSGRKNAVTIYPVGAYLDVPLAHIILVGVAHDKS